MKSRGLEIEQKVRDILTENLGTPLSKRKLVVGYRSNGEPIYHEFDFVSDDQRVIGEVKSDRFTTEKAYATTRRWRLLGACFYMEKVKAETKLLVLTDKDLYRRFKQDVGALISSNIEIRYLHVD